MSTLPPPSHNPRIECILLQTVPWDARQKGVSLLQDCLPDLWEKAVTIGFKYGEENLAQMREEGFCEGKIGGFTEGVELEHNKTVLESTEAAALHEKALEAEWIWGYDIGWKLCSELQGNTQKASMTSAAHPCLLCVTTTQTDPVAVPPLNWPEDTEVLPIFPPPIHHSSPPSLPCDFSALSTSAQKLFEPSTSPSPPPAHAYNIPAAFITPYYYPTTALPCIFSNLVALATFMVHPTCHIQSFFVNTLQTTSCAARLGSRSPPS
jgi:hypothetical protein